VSQIRGAFAEPTFSIGITLKVEATDVAHRHPVDQINEGVLRFRSCYFPVLGRNLLVALAPSGGM
jgi:hypothetical protein